MLSCSSQSYLDPQTVESLVEKQQFTFMARRALPTNYEAVNTLNHLPGATPNRLLDLDYGYSIVLKENTLEVTLPYYGRRFFPASDPNQNSFRFHSEKFTVERSIGKKGKKILLIRPQDLQYVQRIIIEIHPNGSAFTSIEASDRQPISYDGYLMANEENKNLSSE